MLRIPLLTLAALGAMALPAAAQEETIQPGYWEVTNKVEAVIRKTSTERRCITPAQVAKFALGPSNRHYSCNYPTRVFEDGRITLKGTCADKKGQQVQLAAAGSYSPSTFKLVADVDASYAGLPISARFSTDARRLADVCPAGAKTG
ncbi:MAG TPA: DUF3617 family protein [Phenylobacterium sp.]|nr:DUF3617 family protein [Phenylobacterium sp.]